MAVAKRNIYILEDIEWAETRLKEWREYVDSNPLFTLTDRMAYKQMKGGGTMPMVVATVESQIKCIRDTMKEYITLLEVVNKMREVQEGKSKEARGGIDIPASMRLNKNGIENI